MSPTKQGIKVVSGGGGAARKCSNPAVQRVMGGGCGNASKAGGGWVGGWHGTTRQCAHDGPCSKGMGIEPRGRGTENESPQEPEATSQLPQVVHQAPKQGRCQVVVGGRAVGVEGR